MRDSQANNEPASDRDALTLQATALRYAAGVLSPEDATAFETLLASDQSVREALSEAVRLSAAALGHAPPKPDQSVRGLVRDRLFATGFPGWLARRSYRGHPAMWAGFGAAMVAISTVAVLNFAERPGHPASVAPTGNPPPLLVRPRPSEAAPLSVTPPLPEGTHLAVDKEAADHPVSPTTELTAKMGPTIHVEKAVEDDTKWKQR